MGVGDFQAAEQRLESDRAGLERRVTQLGHALVADDYTVDARLHDETPPDARERNLDRFARAFLLPPKALASAWATWFNGRPECVHEAAVRIGSEFQVDMATLARRLAEFALVDAETEQRIRGVKTLRSDFVEYDLVRREELHSGYLPREYEAAVVRLYESETISDARALELLFGSWTQDDLRPLPTRTESEIWQYVS